MKAEHLFAPPREVRDLSDCYFYHIMELPGHGVVGGEWDLRGREDAYLGGVSFRGRRILELGPASGYLSHYMEKQGAEVIGFDLSPEGSWDLVPFGGKVPDSVRAETKEHIRKLNNAWWLSRQALGSHAQVVYGNIYDIPAEVGLVDVTTAGAILEHLRDPFHALYNALRLTRETAVVTEVHPSQPRGHGLRPAILQAASAVTHSVQRGVRSLQAKLSPGTSAPSTVYFVPRPGAKDPTASGTWWCFPPEAVCQFLGVLGFGKTAVTEHYQLFQGREIHMYTVVGTRTEPLP